MRNLLFALAASTLLATAGCDRKVVVVETAPATSAPAPEAKTKTLETTRLGDTVDAFERNPTAENEAEAKRALAKLDGELAKLEEYIAKHGGEQRAVAEGKLANMKEFREAEFKRFTAAQIKAPLTGTAPVDTRSEAEKMGSSLRRAGSAVEDSARDAGAKVKEAAH